MIFLVVLAGLELMVLDSTPVLPDFEIGRWRLGLISSLPAGRTEMFCSQLHLVVQCTH